MQARTNTSAGNRLREAKRQFARWRRGRQRPGRIPTELWVLAAETAAEHGVQETARRLRLNVERLEQWVAQGRRGCGPGESADADFVELPSLPLGSPGECQLEMEDPSGRKVRISLKGAAVAQLATLLATLCGKQEMAS